MLFFIVRKLKKDLVGIGNSMISSAIWKKLARVSFSKASEHSTSPKDRFAMLHPLLATLARFKDAFVLSLILGKVNL